MAVAGANRSLQSTDNTGRQSPIESKRVSYRQDLLSDNELIGVSKRHDGHRAGWSFYQTNNGEVSIRIASDDFSGVIFLPSQTYGELLGAFNHVVVSQNVALFVDY